MRNKEPWMQPVEPIKALTDFIETRADRISEREAKKEIAQIEAPVELVKGVLTFAVLIAIVFCVGVPLVLLLTGRGVGWCHWQVISTLCSIGAGVCIAVAITIVALVLVFKNRSPTK